MVSLEISVHVIFISFSEDSLEIGLLDIFGFENFARNSFEQVRITSRKCNKKTCKFHQFTYYTSISFPADIPGVRLISVYRLSFN